MGKRGRPPKPDDQKLDDRQEIRVNRAEKQEYAKAAREAGFSTVSEWARYHLNQAVTRVLGK